jgi:type IV secretion system protein TrbF
MAKMPNNKSEHKNPYIDAQREWSDRYGVQTQLSSRWFYVSVILLIICIILSLGIIIQMKSTKIYPYIVEIDQFDRTQNVRPAIPTKVTDERIVKAEIMSVMRDLRLVTPDVALQKKAIKNVINHMASRSAALNEVQKFYKISPYKRAQSVIVGIEIEFLLARTKGSWETVWVEKTRSRSGQLISEERYKGLINVSMNFAANESEIIKNPLGVYFNDFTWAKIK